MAIILEDVVCALDLFREAKGRRSETMGHRAGTNEVKGLASARVSQLASFVTQSAHSYGDQEKYKGIHPLSGDQTDGTPGKVAFS